MKLIHPVAYQLSMAEDRIKALEKENEELRVEVARLTGQKVRKSTSRPAVSSNRYRSSTPEQMLPSYARSTKTSRLRSSPHPASSTTSLFPESAPSTPTQPTHISIKRKTCSYKDGKLDVMSFGYLKSTVATRHRHSRSLAMAKRIDLRRSQIMAQRMSKVKNTKASNWWECNDSSHNVADWPAPTKYRGAPKPASTLQIMSEKDWDDMVAQKAIAVRTRLRDNAWTRGYDYHVYIDHDALFDILSATESLAKRCLWGWMRTHHPVECKYRLGYRSDVDFGRQKLEFWLNGLPQGFFTYRYTPSWKVIGKLRDLIYLRNFLHHFDGSWKNASCADGYVETVQELAVLLYDEKSARHARALRDQLHDEAKRTLVEIETLMMLTSLPEAGEPWKPHHADLIQRAASESDGITSSYPPIVSAAAREWNSHCRTYYYGVTVPELDVGTESGCGISSWPGLPTVTISQQYTSVVMDSPTKPRCIRRRCSFSVDAGRMVTDAGGQAAGTSRRRAASM